MSSATAVTPRPHTELTTLQSELLHGLAVINLDRQTAPVTRQTKAVPGTVSSARPAKVRLKESGGVFEEKPLAASPFGHALPKRRGM
jgi:hypothetical protein